jgi:hypothetical protein
MRACRVLSDHLWKSIRVDLAADHVCLFDSEVEACRRHAASTARCEGQTLIYDQLRSERINANVLPSKAGLHRLIHPARYRLGRGCTERSSRGGAVLRSRDGPLGLPPMVGVDIPGSSRHVTGA